MNMYGLNNNHTSRYLRKMRKPDSSVPLQGMTSNEALETIRAHRPIRPNPGFLGQLANYDNLIHKRLVWT